MGNNSTFDQPHYNALNEARGAVLGPLLASLSENVGLHTVVDVGSGLGYFSALLKDLGFDVLAVDGRPGNVEEAKRRYPKIEFRIADAEDTGIRSLGKFDLVLCLGLLYHLENPFLAIRNLFEMAQKVAIIEGICFPSDEPILAVRDEGKTEDQGLRYVALYPSESALVKLLYRSGFSYVYRMRKMPDHPHYRDSSVRKKSRTVLVAARVPLSTDSLELAIEPVSGTDPWMVHTRSARLRRFMSKPWKEKAASMMYRWVRTFPSIPLPVRLPFGGWWLARNDFVGAALFQGGFENIECSFVDRFLAPGMTVLDIGSHHGFYTLMASRKVGLQGKVIAVEASPRERERLRLHLRINRCKNVTVESRALGEAKGIAELYLVSGGETGCNSLRPPDVARPTKCVSVSVEPLDRVLEEHEIDRVDFIKLDVEGAELSVLKGARNLLDRRPRPLILVEVEDIRTQPWGYPAREIIRYLTSLDYRWFRPIQNGRIEEIDSEQLEYDGNFVAVPNEELARVHDMIIDPKRYAPSQGVSWT